MPVRPVLESMTRSHARSGHQWLVARPITQGQQLLERDLRDNVVLHARPFGINSDPHRKKAAPGAAVVSVSVYMAAQARAQFALTGRRPWSACRSARVNGVVFTQKSGVDGSGA